jgi:hypothetical protein
VRPHQFESGHEPRVNLERQLRRMANHVPKASHQQVAFLLCHVPRGESPERRIGTQSSARRFGEVRDRLGQPIDEPRHTGRVGQACEKAAGDLRGQLGGVFRQRARLSLARPVQLRFALCQRLVRCGPRLLQEAHLLPLGLLLRGGENIRPRGGHTLRFGLCCIPDLPCLTSRRFRLIQSGMRRGLPLDDDPADRPEQETRENPEQDQEVERLKTQCPPVDGHRT